MIEKLEPLQGLDHSWLNKINELVDAVNELQESQNTYWTDIAEIKKELQTRAENVQPDAESRPENVQDKFAEQRKWIGYLVRYKICEWQGGWYTDVLDDIVDHPIYPFKMRNGQTAQVCEPVKPDDDIIYKGGDNE